jgi:hypothetical protein
MDDVSSQLAPLTVLDLQGTTVTLGPLWKEQAVVLVFLRQFG